MSSGGFMTVQMHIIFSALFVGAGIFAGGPYECTHHKLGVEPSINCTIHPDKLNLSYLYNIIRDNFENPSRPIDDPHNIKDQPVYIYSGTIDTVVEPGVVDKTNEVYKYLEANVQYVNRFISEHVFPTDLPYVPWHCGKVGMPYIGQCNYDGAGHMLKKVLPEQDKYPLKERVWNWEEYGQLVEFDQMEHTANFTLSQLSPTGYVYIPNNCNTNLTVGKTGCKLHVAFHGCSQGNKFLNQTYVRNTGYLEWAAPNDLIVLFPQVSGDAGSTPLLNKGGCWDFWSYTGDHFTDKTGIQPVAIKSMIDRIMANPTDENLELSEDEEL